MAAAVLVASTVLAPARGARGQISPGSLHASHAAWEGVANCTRCHSLGRQVDDAKCLECHGPLADRIRAGRGLHAGSDFAGCGRCHVDHHGRDFELVHWKEGEENFDHDRSGYVLEGKHGRVGCRECHRASNVHDAELAAQPGIDLDRTWLGLGRACAACHRDPHEGELDARCETCHDQERWKPASSFDHARSRYPLEGRHAEATCEACHGRAEEGAVVRYRGPRFGACSDCHADAHGGRLGATCERCHGLDGWGLPPGVTFDHDRTRYPLRGGHGDVACDRCHHSGEAHRGLSFGACADCHGGYHHRARYLGRADDLACEGCHTVSTFVPSTYTMERHAEARYPLAGAHRAVACPVCHAGAEAQAACPVEEAPYRCAGCHIDPHGPDLAVTLQRGGCEACHETTSWRVSTYDHAWSDYPLDGRHADAACPRCHRPRAGSVLRSDLQFQGVTRVCEDCHQDVHRGQFASSGPSSHAGGECARCHDTRDWLAERFDHNRDSRYPLDGAHTRVACGGCHLAVGEGDGSFVRYRPLDSRCEACHAKGEPMREEDR